MCQVTTPGGLDVCGESASCAPPLWAPRMTARPRVGVAALDHLNTTVAASSCAPKAWAGSESMLVCTLAVCNRYSSQTMHAAAPATTRAAGLLKARCLAPMAPGRSRRAGVGSSRSASFCGGGGRGRVGLRAMQSRELGVRRTSVRAPPAPPAGVLPGGRHAKGMHYLLGSRPPVPHQQAARFVLPLQQRFDVCVVRTVHLTNSAFLQLAQAVDKQLVTRLPSSKLRGKTPGGPLHRCAPCRPSRPLFLSVNIAGIVLEEAQLQSGALEPGARGPTRGRMYSRLEERQAYILPPLKGEALVLWTRLGTHTCHIPCAWRWMHGWMDASGPHRERLLTPTPTPAPCPAPHRSHIRRVPALLHWLRRAGCHLDHRHRIRLLQCAGAARTGHHQHQGAMHAQPVWQPARPPPHQRTRLPAHPRRTAWARC